MILFFSEPISITFGWGGGQNVPLVLPLPPPSPPTITLPSHPPNINSSNAYSRRTGVISCLARLPAKWGVFVPPYRTVHSNALFWEFFVLFLPFSARFHTTYHAPSMPNTTVLKAPAQCICLYCTHCISHYIHHHHHHQHNITTDRDNDCVDTNEWENKIEWEANECVENSNRSIEARGFTLKCNGMESIHFTLSYKSSM